MITTAAMPNALPAEPCKPWSSRAIESPSRALRDLSLESFAEEVKDFTRPRSAYSPGGTPTRDNGQRCLLHRKPQGRKIRSDNRRSGEPARLDGFAVIRFR
jgi:hypothetical protein